MKLRVRHGPLAWLTALLAIGCATLASLGCDGDGDGDDSDGQAHEPTWRSLVSADGWAPLDAADDPGAAHRPDEVVCSRLGWYAEGESLEIDTSKCNYLAVEHALLEALRPGDVLRLQLSWLTLISLEPAEGHLAVWVGDRLLWEERVTIPGHADARDLELIWDRRVPAGTPVVFHLHNHGTNTWRLRGLSVLRQADAAEPSG